MLEEIRRTNKKNFAFVRQGKPLGLGQVLSCAQQFMNSQAFLVVLSDVIIGCDLNLKQPQQEERHGKFVLQPASRARDSARIFCHLKIIENQPCVANQLAHFLCHAVGAFGFDEAHSEAA